jgi:hypothetical protein
MKKIIFVLLLLKTSLIFSQKILDQVVDAETIYNEDFKTTGNWPQKRDDTSTAFTKEGVYYTLAVLKNINVLDKVGRSLANEKNFWQLNTVVQYSDGSGFYGLSFGASDDTKIWSFVINAMGEYGIIERNGKEVKILKQGKSQKINTGKGAINILTVQTDDDYIYNNAGIRFFVNGSNIEGLTKEEEAIEKVTREKNKADMQNDATLHSINPKGYGGNGKVGILVMRGAAANFANIWLKIKQNKGGKIMYKNRWGYDASLCKYLPKNIALEEEEARNKAKIKEGKKEDEYLSATKKSIENLSKKILHPYGENFDAAIPNEQTVLWIKKLLDNFQFDVGNPLYFYPEKEERKTTDSSNFYIIKHYLPNIDYGAEAFVNTKSKNAQLSIVLGEGLPKNEAIKLSSNYLANVAAAFDIADANYSEEPGKTGNKEIPRELLLRINNKYMYTNIVGGIMVGKNKDETFNISLILFSFKNK